MKRLSGLAGHAHHDRKYEYCYDYDGRLKFIMEEKPENERKLRQRLFFIFPKDRLPGLDSPEWADYKKARADCEKAEADYDKSWTDCEKARADYYNKAADCEKTWTDYKKAEADYLLKYSKELDALHDELCPDCTFDGKTIFTRNTQSDNKGEWY